MPIAEGAIAVVAPRRIRFGIHDAIGVEALVGERGRVEVEGVGEPTDLSCGEGSGYVAS
jgi:hypothetical protein